MSDYEPIDLSELCNAGTELLPSDDPPVIGAQTFRGLPFQVGKAGSSGCFIRLSEGDAPVSIPVGEAARQVVFAHRLLETDVPQGGQIGNHVADYIVHLSTGDAVTVAVRERFQISAFGPPFDAGTYTGAPYAPFQAVADKKAALYPRYEGEFSDAGNRQTEAMQADARWYYLWAWENPEPDSEIESIEIVPKGGPFIIAAITLGRVDEHPLYREANRAIKIELTDPDLASQPFDIEVEVDRGETTYAYPLPKGSCRRIPFESPNKGWGERYQRARPVLRTWRCLPHHRPRSA